MDNTRHVVRENWRLCCCATLLLSLVIILEASCRLGSPEAGLPFEGPSFKHWLGTVDWGGDLARYIHTALWRSVLLACCISVPAVVTGYIVGGLWALSSPGSFRSRAILVLIMGLLGPTPIALMLAILHVFPEPNSSTALVVAMGSIAWPGLALRFRNEIQQHLDKPFIQEALTQGTRQSELLFVEVLPIMLPIVEKTLLLAFIFGVEAEALIGYLGIGETRPSIGRLLQESIAAFENGEPRIVHGLRYILVVTFSLGSIVGALKLFTDWRDDRRIMKSLRKATRTTTDHAGNGWTVDVRHRSSGIGILAGASVPFMPGKIVVIAGASGGGKSLAVRAVADMLPPELHATVTLRGTLPSPQEVIVVPQGMQEHFSDTFSIGQYLSFAGIPVEELEASLNAVGLSIAELQDSSGAWKTGRQVSGGMSQKLAVAMVARVSTRVLIFDETIAALDPESAMDMGKLLRRLLASRTDLAVIVVNHRPTWTRSFADHVVFVDAGSSVFSSNCDEFWNATESPPLSTPSAVSRYLQAVTSLQSVDRKARVSDTLNSPVLLNVDHLRPCFNSHTGPLSFELRAGEIAAIVGSNGSGKTTILRTIAGELEPGTGSVSLSALQNDSGHVRMSGQNPAVSLNPALTVHRILVNAIRRWGLGSTKTAATLIRQACDQARFPEQHLMKTPMELSGGMRVRAGLARTLLGNVNVLLLDEPTAGLDPEVTHELLETIKALADDGAAVLLVMHDPEQLDFLGATRHELSLN